MDNDSIWPTIIKFLIVFFIGFAIGYVTSILKKESKPINDQKSRFQEVTNKTFGNTIVYLIKFDEKEYLLCKDSNIFPIETKIEKDKK